jgi:hypothetical protein
VNTATLTSTVAAIFAFGLPAMLSMALAGCGVEHGRYLVTAAPIDVGVGDPLCVAIDPGSSRGVWWWQSRRRTDCEERSTGPGVFSAERATLTRSNGGGADVRFNVPTMTGNVDVELLVDTQHFRTPTGTQVDTRRRADLDLPGNDGNQRNVRPTPK